MKSKIIILLLVIAAFVGGMMFAKQSSNAPQVQVNQQDVEYQGGYRASEEGSKTQTTSAANGKVHEVREGELIQDAVKAANPGDTILVYPGTYSETVYVDKDNIRLIGVIEKGKRALLDGRGIDGKGKDGEFSLNDAILYSGNNIVIENFEIVGYKGNAIMGQAGNNFEIRNNVIRDTGVYGIFPQLGKNGIIEYNVVSGIEDAAIYVGMSDNVVVSHNDVFDSVAGIEFENSRHGIAENNFVHNNTGGILAFITPGLPIKTASDIIIRNNFVTGNNHPNFGAPGSIVSGIPAGTGILVMANDDVVIEDNIISNNKVAGILITDHENGGATYDPDSEPNPDRVSILDNVMLNNGYDTIADIKAFQLSKLKSGNVDIAAIGGGEGSCINNRHRYLHVGIDDYVDCSFNNTDNIDTYYSEVPVPARVIEPSERGMIAYLGVCAGCHSYTGRLIGPPIQVIQALYLEDPEGLAAYISNPTKKRPDYPEMPSQAYLGEETLKAVSEYVLQVGNK